MRVPQIKKTQSKNYFVISVQVPVEFALEEANLTREQFFSWVWNEFSNSGLQGVHEGSLLSEQAVDQGMETTPWILDGGVAPEKRDWIGDQAETDSELYFETGEDAEQAFHRLRDIFSLAQPSLKIGQPAEKETLDWNAKWKASFRGINLAPHWHILPPWEPLDRFIDGSESNAEARALIINPGAGFGTGTHETTQLCLEVMGKLGASEFSGKKFLDFGSGSGVLTLAAARLGAHALGVEIDPLGIDNATENLRLNLVLDPELKEQIAFSEELPKEKESFDGIVANILRPILIENSLELVKLLRPSSTLILSGLLEEDCAEIISCFEECFKKLNKIKNKFELFSKNEWRCLVWRM